MSKKVKMEDIAKELGVSKNTVSLTLRGMPGISEETKKLIYEKANELGYKYKKSNDINNFISNTCCICLLVAKNTIDSANFYSSIQIGIEDEARQNGINTILYYFDEEVDSSEPLCLANGIASAIITLGRFSLDAIKELKKYNLPIVMVDHYFENLKLDYIISDNHYGAYIAIEHLIKCGHREIGFVGDVNVSPCFLDRFLGYRSALNYYGVKFSKDLILEEQSLENLVKEDLAVASNVLAKNKANLPTSYFCCNDAEAIALIKVLSYLGKRVPEDVSIIGFDDIDLASLTTPGLTTIKVEKGLIGKKAVKRIVERLQSSNLAEEKLLISTTLIERGTVKNITI